MKTIIQNQAQRAIPSDANGVDWSTARCELGVARTLADIADAEASAPHDRPTLTLVKLEGADDDRPPLDVELAPMDDGATWQSPEHVVEFGYPFGPDGCITTHLTQWTEPGSSGEVEVTIGGDIAQSWGCTPAEARGVAAQLRKAADAIDALAVAAEALLATR